MTIIKADDYKDLTFCNRRRGRKPVYQVTNKEPPGFLFLHIPSAAPDTLPANPPTASKSPVYHGRRPPRFSVGKIQQQMQLSSDRRQNALHGAQIGPIHADQQIKPIVICARHLLPRRMLPLQDSLLKQLAPRRRIQDCRSPHG